MGKFVSAVGSVQAGNAQRRADQEEAQQLESKAGSTQATSQRDAADQLRLSQLAASRAQAVAAASGAGALDPTVLKIMSNIAGEGEYKKDTALYEGQTEADSLRAQARAKRKAGDDAHNAGTMGGIGDTIGGFTSMYTGGTGS